MSVQQCEVCVDGACQNKQKLLAEIEDAFGHWGHKKLPFQNIHEQLKSKDSQKRFQDMLTTQDLQNFIRQQITTLFNTVNGFLMLIQQSFENQIAQITDDNRKLKLLYKEVSKDLKDINFESAGRYEGWERLLDSSKDSKALQHCKAALNESMNLLQRDLTAILSQTLNYQQNQRPIRQAGLSQQLDGINIVQITQASGEQINNDKKIVDKGKHE